MRSTSSAVEGHFKGFRVLAMHLLNDTDLIHRLQERVSRLVR